MATDQTRVDPPPPALSVFSSLVPITAGPF